MDTYAEQLIKKKYDNRDYLIIAGSIIGAIVVLIGCLLLSFYIVPYLAWIVSFLFVGLCYLVWWLITSRNVEYEYCVTNGDVDIDRIVSKRKRERVVSVRGERVESFVPCTQELLAKPFDRRVMATSAPADATWCLTYRSKKNGHTIVLMTPNERVFALIYGGLTKTVQMETDRKRKGL